MLCQSARLAAYRNALAALDAEGLTYPCFCTRKEIAEEVARAQALHLSNPPTPFAGAGASYGHLPLQRAGAREGENRPDGFLYPGTCRHLTQQERDARIAKGETYALRLDAGKAAKRVGPLTFLEHQAPVTVDPLLFGDLVLARKDVPASYHLAVVVDDAFQGVTLVMLVRIFCPPPTCSASCRRCAGRCRHPSYAHHRLILDENGRKFSKRDASVTLRALRAAGVTPGDIRARLGF